MKSHLGHILRLRFFFGAFIVGAESNKLNLEKWLSKQSLDKKCLTILKALTLISLCYSFSKYDLSFFSQSWFANNITDIQKEVRPQMKL